MHIACTTPCIYSASLPGYISGIRTSLVVLGHPRLPFLSECFALRELYNAYHTWESAWSADHGKLSNTRIAVPASVIKAMMTTVLSSYDKDNLRDLAIVVLVRVHGLRADSVQSIELDDFNFTLSGWTVVVTVLKGHRSEQACRYGARRFVAPSQGQGYFCIDVMKRWLEARTSSEKLLFGASCNLDTSLRRLLGILNIETPAGCSYSSHSIRSAAFKKSCLLGDVSMGVLVMQYNWVAVSMPKIYFDHRLTLTPSLKLFASSKLHL